MIPVYCIWQTSSYTNSPTEATSKSRHETCQVSHFWSGIRSHILTESESWLSRCSQSRLHFIADGKISFLIYLLELAMGTKVGFQADDFPLWWVACLPCQQPPLSASAVFLHLAIILFTLKSWHDNINFHSGHRKGELWWGVGGVCVKQTSVLERTITSLPETEMFADSWDNILSGFLKRFCQLNHEGHFQV